MQVSQWMVPSRSPTFTLWCPSPVAGLAVAEAEVSEELAKVTRCRRVSASQPRWQGRSKAENSAPGGHAWHRYIPALSPGRRAGLPSEGRGAGAPEREFSTRWWGGCSGPSSAR